MSISRRIFLTRGLLSAVAGSVALSGGKLALGQRANRLRPTVQPTGEIPLLTQSDTLFSYGRAAFEPCVGSVFQANVPFGSPVNLTLLSVKGYSAKAISRRMTTQARETEAFMLIFRSEEKIPSTGVPTLSHPVLGKFDLFLTVDGKNGEFFYEAVINHVI